MQRVPAGSVFEGVLGLQGDEQDDHLDHLAGPMEPFQIPLLDLVNL